MTKLIAIYTKMYVLVCNVQDISNHINTTSSTSTHPLNSETVQKSWFESQHMFERLLHRSLIFSNQLSFRQRRNSFSVVSLDRQQTPQLLTTAYNDWEVSRVWKTFYNIGVFIFFFPPASYRFCKDREQFYVSLDRQQTSQLLTTAYNDWEVSRVWKTFII